MRLSDEHKRQFSSPRAAVNTKQIQKEMQQLRDLRTRLLRSQRLVSVMRSALQDATTCDDEDICAGCRERMDAALVLAKKKPRVSKRAKREAEFKARQRRLL